MITVYIPSIYSNKLTRMVYDFSTQTTLPEKIVVIDNRPNDLKDIKPIWTKNFPLLEMRPMEPEMSVNEVWNLAMKECPVGHHLCIASDDMRVEEQFFAKSEKVFIRDPKIGVICPHLTVLAYESYMNERPPFGSGSTVISVKGKGNAGIFIIRNTLVKKIPLIPTEEGLHLFFGDNWIGNKVHNMGFKWVRFINSLAYHGPRIKNKEVHQKIKIERRIYHRVKEGC